MLYRLLSGLAVASLIALASPMTLAQQPSGVVTASPPLQALPFIGGTWHQPAPSSCNTRDAWEAKFSFASYDATTGLFLGTFWIACVNGGLPAGGTFANNDSGPTVRLSPDGQHIVVKFHRNNAVYTWDRDGNGGIVASGGQSKLTMRHEE